MSASDSFTGRVLDETREEIIRADGKASIILASAGIAVGAVLAGLIAGNFSLKGQHAFVWVTTIGAFVLVGAGIVLIALAVYPRIGAPDVGRARYFREIATYQSVDALMQDLTTEADNDERRDAEQLLVLSRLVLTKYRFTQWSLRLLGAGFLVGVIAAVASIATKY